MIYLPIYMWLILIVNVGKYTSPMNLMGFICESFFFVVGSSNVVFMNFAVGESPTKGGE